jgi:hypothetical protein
MKYFWLFAILSVNVLGSNTYGQDTCRLKKDKDGIKVYTCQESDSKFKSLRAEFLLPGTALDQLRSFLLDGNNYYTWQYNMVESKILNQANEDEMIVRSVIDAPWPVTNREMIVRIIMQKEDHDLEVSVNAVPYDYPVSDDLVRVAFSQANWKVTKINDRDLSVYYTLRIDPGGSLPTWLVNMAMAEGPYETFRNLREKLTE